MSHFDFSVLRLPKLSEERLQTLVFIMNILVFFFSKIQNCDFRRKSYFDYEPNYNKSFMINKISIKFLILKMTPESLLTAWRLSHLYQSYL